MSLAHHIMRNYWDQAITFDEYLQVADQRLNHPANENEKIYHQYYELGLQRMERVLKTFKVDDALLQALKSKSFSGKVLIISEPWCGDASATVPAVAKFFEAAGIAVRVFLRDADPSLINQFLVNGTQSIPIVILLRDDFQTIAHWGPRPRFGTILLQKFKQNPEDYPQEKFYNDLQIYYAKNQGKDAIQEIIDLI